MTNRHSFPGGSKNRVNRAGENIRANIATEDDLEILNEWRAAHRIVLNTFQELLRRRTKDTDIIVAQRHKRRATIRRKLNRYKKMNLSRMDDVAGIRLIFPTIALLTDFRLKFHSARFKHKRKNEPDKYDYIERPKKSGYRGIHDVFEYNVNSFNKVNCNGLLVEIQYRTLIQHYWATAVELIGFITENQPKFDHGDKRYIRVMALASEILARNYEGCRGPFPMMSVKDLVGEFTELSSKLNLIAKLMSVELISMYKEKSNNVILTISRLENDKIDLDVKSFGKETDALKALFILEKELPDSDIVLVKADTPEEVRLAFKNYFSDAQEFTELVVQGCIKLADQEKKMSPILK